MPGHKNWLPGPRELSPEQIEAQRKKARPGIDRKRKRGERLTLADRYRIIETHRDHPEMTYEELAISCGTTKHTARLVCIAASKNLGEMMAANALPILEDWIVASQQGALRGDHRPAREWLLHAGVIEQFADPKHGTGPAVVIINQALPGLPGAEMIIDVGGTSTGTSTGTTKPSDPAISAARAGTEED